jgi:hypothetical protein
MDAQQARMLKKVKQGKAVLFLGSGASMSANAPSGDKLAEMVQSEFLPHLAKPASDLMEVCGNVLDTPGIDRSALEDFIRAKLDLQPATAHKRLCLNRWQAIFTTNFDDLVETAYRVTADREQRCEPVFGRDFSRTQSDYLDVVRLFKLMGSVNGSDEGSRMALSRSDYNHKLRQIGPLFKLLYDLLKTEQLCTSATALEIGWLVTLLTRSLMKSASIGCLGAGHYFRNGTTRQNNSYVNARFFLLSLRLSSSSKRSPSCHQRPAISSPVRPLL